MDLPEATKVLNADGKGDCQVCSEYPRPDGEECVWGNMADMMRKAGIIVYGAKINALHQTITNMIKYRSKLECCGICTSLDRDGFCNNDWSENYNKKVSFRDKCKHEFDFYKRVEKG